MKIIVDDIRDFPTKGDYNCVRTFEDCIWFIDIFKEIEFISLDYDLGSAHTGYDILVHMHENGISANHINIHSEHKEGIARMSEYATINFPFSNITQTKLRQINKK